MFRVILCMSPLEKVPFATFYPRCKYLYGTYFSKKDFFKWAHSFYFSSGEKEEPAHYVVFLCLVYLFIMQKYVSFCKKNKRFSLKMTFL